MSKTWKSIFLQNIIILHSWDQLYQVIGKLSLSLCILIATHCQMNLDNILKGIIQINKIRLDSGTLGNQCDWLVWLVVASKAWDVWSGILLVSKMITYLFVVIVTAGSFSALSCIGGLIPDRCISQTPILCGFWLSLTNKRPQQNTGGRRNPAMPLVPSDFGNRTAAA